ncbi:D-3-phosphoglycerate dehydrogenase [Bacillus sp. NRRL B-14911]|nr:D-3-phosphoglycerate dehydrogenase [Bacillus sp. NRRL B-14911]
MMKKTKEGTGLKIVSSLQPEKDLQDKIKNTFPDAAFEFYESMEQAEGALSQAEVFITYGEDLTAAHIESAKKLKWIMVMSAGLELMPLKECEERGILITNARGVHSIPMAEFALGMMLMHEKKAKKLIVNEENEVWDRNIQMGELRGKTMLILGTGAIGSEIARLGKAFGLKTWGINRSGSPVPHIDSLFSLEELDILLPEADFLISVLPSTGETRHLLRMEHFRRMKNSAVFINLGRGDVAGEEILLDVMQKRLISHAYLDVFETEPLEKGHPFWKLDNITVTPHLSSRSAMYLPRSFEIFAHNLHTYIQSGNDYVNKIDPGKGY